MPRNTLVSSPTTGLGGRRRQLATRAPCWRAIKSCSLRSIVVAVSDQAPAGVAPHQRDSSISARHERLTLHEYLQVVRRRKWTILYTAVVVQLLAVLFMLTQTPVYEATAKVMLSRQSLANSLNGLQDPS